MSSSSRRDFCGDMRTGDMPPHIESYVYGDIMIMVETDFLIALSLSNALAATFSII